MSTSKTIEISIPADMPQAYVNLLKDKIEETVAHRCDYNKNWGAVLADLEKHGWRCQLHLNWAAEAKRGSDYEKADGTLLCETIESLRQLTSLHSIENCP
jgi:hypothetical protein